MSSLPVFFRHLVLLGLWMLALPALAGGTAVRVIDHSALEQRIELLPLLVHQELTWPLAASRQFDPRMGAALDLLLSRNYEADAVRAVLIRQLEARLDRRELMQVANWYESPQGRRVTALERTALLDVARGLDPEMLRRLEQRYRGSARESLFVDYDAALGAAKLLVDTSQQVQLVLVDAMAELQRGAGQAGLRRLRENIRHRRFVTRGVVEQGLYLRYLYTYRQLSDTQLREYLVFLRSAPARHCNRVTGAVLQHAVLAPPRELVRQLRILHEQAPE